MKILFASRFSPLIVAETAANKLYLSFILCYFFNRSISSKAPVLID